MLGGFHLPSHSVALGSVKSNFGHLKGAAGAAGLLKTTLALRDKVLPPSLHCEHPNPDIDFAHSPLYVNTELKPWTVPPDGVRRAGLSAFGFGGTNFHAVLEEYIPHRLNGNGKRSVAVNEMPLAAKEPTMNVHDVSRTSSSAYKAPLRGALLIGTASEAALVERLRAVEKDARSGSAPAPAVPAESDLRAPERLAIDYGNATELAEKAGSALKAMKANQPAMWRALRAQGIFRGHRRLLCSGAVTVNECADGPDLALTAPPVSCSVSPRATPAGGDGSAQRRRRSCCRQRRGSIMVGAARKC